MNGAVQQSAGGYVFFFCCCSCCCCFNGNVLMVSANKKLFEAFLQVVGDLDSKRWSTPASHSRELETLQPLQSGDLLLPRGKHLIEGVFANGGSARRQGSCINHVAHFIAHSKCFTRLKVQLGLGTSKKCQRYKEKTAEKKKPSKYSG